MHGREFRLALVDTNVISRCLKDDGAWSSLVRYLNERVTIPTISIWTAVELRRRSELWAKFLEKFDGVPLVLLKSPIHVFEAEKESYPEPSAESVVQYVFYPGNEDPDGQLSVFMQKLFSVPEVIESERKWAESWKEEVVQSISGLKKNFAPRGERYGIADGERFVDLGVEQWVIHHELPWAKRVIARDGMIDRGGFPSVSMSFWTVFFRFYDHQREPEVQDVFDIMISSAAPYVEAVMTEGLQADILRKVRRRDSLLDGLEDVMTIGDVVRPGNGS